jgi:ABC-type transporter Mla MlaB component
MVALTVPERIDADNATAMLASLTEALAGAGTATEPPTLDLAPLAVFDSSALSLLLQLERGLQAVAAGGESGGTSPALVLLNPPAKLQELAELYGVAGLLFGAPARGEAPQAE